MTPAMGIISPIDIGDGLLKGVFGGAGKIVDAAGSLALKGVQAVLDWIYGGLQDTITPFVMKFLTRVDLVFDGGLERMVVPLVVIGSALMVLGAVALVIQGYGAVIAGTDSSASVISGALMRVAGLALLLGSWHTVVPIAVDVANEFSAYVLTDQAVKEGLARTFTLGASGASPGIAASGVAPIVMVILLTLLAICFILLLLLKYVVTFAFAVLYLGGPVMIGLGAFPGLGSTAINVLVRSLATLMLIPLAWATVFAAWAAVNSALVTNPPKDAGAYALTVINGPGLFVASCLVVLGVTRVLVKMATPLGAPLSVPGARMVMAAAAYKAVPALLAKGAAAGAALPGAEAVGEHNSRYEGTPYQRAVAASAAYDGQSAGAGMDLAMAGGGGTPSPTGELVSGGTEDEAANAPAAEGHEPTSTAVGATAQDASTAEAQTPEPAMPAPDFDAARGQIADRGPVSHEQVASALERLDDDERAHVRDAAEGARALQQAAGGEEGDVYFRERLASGMAEGTFRQAGREHAATIGAGSHQDALQALKPTPPNPANVDKKGYTERELRRDWTQPVRGEDEQDGR